MSIKTGTRMAITVMIVMVITKAMGATRGPLATPQRQERANAARRQSLCQGATARITVHMEHMLSDHVDPFVIAGLSSKRNGTKGDVADRAPLGTRSGR